MRTGPRPLMTHLGLALSSQGLSHDDPKAHEALKGMMAGIRKYQTHPYKRAVAPLERIWEEGEVTLFYHPAATKAKGAVFILPSMVNDATILDITEEQSFVRWLGGQGYEVYLLDWGRSHQDDAQNKIDSLFEERIAPALKIAAEKSDGKAHLLGYCMGGTLATAAAQIYNDNVASLTMLAAPWDFHAGAKDLTQWVEFWAPAGLNSILTVGYLPSDWIQTVFASLNPFQTMQKFTTFGEVEGNKTQEELFVAVEDWLNTPVHLPGALAQHIIQDWFIDNKLIEGRWEVLGQQIAPEQITVPIQIVASINDRLVPYESSVAFMEGMDAMQHLKAACGHIGFMASRKASKEVWAPMIRFFESV